MFFTEKRLHVLEISEEKEDSEKPEKMDATGQEEGLEDTELILDPEIKKEDEPDNTGASKVLKIKEEPL